MKKRLNKNSLYIKISKFINKLFSNKRFLFILSLIIIVIFKLVILIPQTISSLPGDNQNYLSIVRVIFNNNITEVEANLIEYPRPLFIILFFAILAKIHMPIHFMYEIILITIAFLYQNIVKIELKSRGLLHTKICNIFRIAIFSFVIFNPAINYHMIFSMADLPLSLLILTLFPLFYFAISAQNKKSIYFVFLIGILFGLIWNTKTEFILYSILLLTIIFCIVLQFSKKSYGYILILLLGFGIIQITSIFITNTINNNIGATIINNGPVITKHSKQLVRTLLKIKTNSTKAKYLTIDREMRDIAYQHSPTLAKYQNKIDSDLYHKYTKETTGIENEVDIERILLKNNIGIKNTQIIIKELNEAMNTDRIKK